MILSTVLSVNDHKDFDEVLSADDHNDFEFCQRTTIMILSVVSGRP